MSFKSLLKHRCIILRLVETAQDGSPVFEWQPITQADGTTQVRCFLDLNFIRRGKDPIWTPEAGRPSDRSGVLFITTPVKSGDRIQMVKGPAGMFEIQGAVDEAWTPSAQHHLEIGVKEVAVQIARGQYSQGGVSA